MYAVGIIIFEILFMTEAPSPARRTSPMRRPACWNRKIDNGPKKLIALQYAALEDELRRKKSTVPLELRKTFGVQNFNRVMDLILSTTCSSEKRMNATVALEFFLNVINNK